jgi:hypothetical protein
MRWLLKRIGGQDFEQLFSLGPETGGGKLMRIFLGLPRENNYPRLHQPGSSLQSSIGVASPWQMDSRMPGIESR